VGQTSDEIVSEIDRAREQLRANLQELEMRARGVADWRNHFRNHPVPMAVAALVGGMLLAALVSRR
jgi:ElaB/YqjD/DUF883 family membrane-anchored ribosome-binding protein